MNVDTTYKALVQHILNHGQDVPDRTGVGTRSVFGYQMRFDLRDGFPLVGLKRTFWKGAFVEMLWMLRGRTDVHYLHEYGVRIWDEWADETGDLGPVYGHQWRQWGADPIYGVDQLAQLIEGLRIDPRSRRHVMSAWNPEELPLPGLVPNDQPAYGRMALAPCHCLVQFHVDADYRLHCQLYQRSADVFLGVPFNIAGYALLTHLLAHHLGYGVGDFIHTLGDAHLYQNHLAQASEMVERDPTPTPRLVMQHELHCPVDEVIPADLYIEGYEPHPAIKGEVAV